MTVNRRTTIHNTLQLASEHNPKWYGRRTGLAEAALTPSPVAPLPAAAADVGVLPRDFSLTLHH